MRDSRFCSSMGEVLLFGVRNLVVLCFGVWLVACSTTKPAIPPVPLDSVNDALPIEQLWDTKVGNGHDGKFLQLAPAITEQHLYAVAHNGELLKLDRLTGARIWRQEIPHRITAGLDAGYGMVVMGSANGRVIAVSQESGDILWDVGVTGQLLASPKLSAELVLAQSMDGRLYALERDTGLTRWVYDTTINTLTLRGNVSPWVAGNLTMAGFANGKLVALETATGLVAWEQPVSEPTGRSELARLNDVTGRFWVTRNRVYAANFQGNLVAIDIPTGRLIWSKPLSSYAGVTEQYGILYVVDAASHVSAIDAINGGENWQTQVLRGRDASTPLSYQGFVVVGDYEGYVHWLSRDSGKVLGRVRPDRFGVRSAPQQKDGIVYVQGNQGNLAAYRVVEE